jgi:chaperonin cofactor prefoldin
VRKNVEHTACAWLSILMLVAVSPAYSQELATVPSLAEIARKLKDERAQEKQKPVATYTNDNLPSRESLGIVAVDLAGQVKAKAPATGKNVAAAEEHDEKYFRSKAEKLRSQMEFDERQLYSLRQQLGLAQTQYYPDPQKTLEQESTPAFQTDLEKLRAKIAGTQKALADDQKALDDLQQELRRAGGDPGWIR